jgi:TolA-binding protein
LRDVSAEFRAAMSAFDSGDHASAIALFGAFISAHPYDARAQDAAYLRVLALQRTGDTGATQRAARDYLARYPQGFRRSEVEALAR